MTTPPIPANDLPELGPVTSKQYLVHIGVVKSEGKDVAMTLGQIKNTQPVETPIVKRTSAQARQWLDEQGMSQAEVGRRFGVTSSLVDAILSGTKPCKRGASHNIAVYLGLKHGQAVATRQSNGGSRAAASHAGAAA